MSTTHRGRFAEELARRLSAALRGAQLYAPEHPLLKRNVAALTDTVTTALAVNPTVTIGIVEDDLVVGDVPVPRAADTMGELLRRLQHAGIERIVFDSGVNQEEITELVQCVAHADRDGALSAPRLKHIRVGKLQVEQQVDAPGDMATFQRLYQDATGIAERLWESATTEGKPDADAARGIVDSLAQAVAQNRTALLALTALKNYDNYTFTHMVNVSILTMGQARGLGIEGSVLRQIGLAALLHDIGKVKTPPEILNKPGQAYRRGIRDSEASHHGRRGDPPHDAGGSPLAPIVAFEHHLRADGSGYPGGSPGRRSTLPRCCAAFPTSYDANAIAARVPGGLSDDRILAVLQRNDGTNSIRISSAGLCSWWASIPWQPGAARH
jgi:response regulator RpfG family c-di-GMP phosphodiesterase